MKRLKRLSFWTVLKYAFLTVSALLILYPIFMVFTGSFRTNSNIMMNPFGLPTSLNLANFDRAWNNGRLYMYYQNSIIVTFVSVIFIILFSSMVAFIMSRRDFKFRKPLFIMIVIGMTIPFQVGIIPLYMQMSHMGLINKHVGIIIVYVVSYMSFSTFLMYGFFRTVPAEIQEAALIDGVSNFRMYWNIIMPLSPAVVTAVAIFNLMYVWNDMFFSLVMIQSNPLKTLMIGLLGFRGQYMSDYATMFAGVVLVSLPMIVLFFLLQKRFVEGIAAGAIKG